MSGIGNQGFANGFMRGYEFVDENVRQSKRDQMAIEDRQYQRDQTALQNERLARQETRTDEAIKTADERYNSERAYREGRDKELDSRYDEQSKRAERSEARAWEAQRLAAMTAQRQQEQYERGLVKEELMRYWAVDPLSVPPELAAKADKLGMSSLNPLNPRFGQDGPVAARMMQQIGAGNLEYVNSPQGLADATVLYGDQIRSGIGEFVAPMGGKIVDKRLKKFHAAPGGKFATEVEVTLDNGKKYTAPLTINRSADPNDPVQLTDMSVVMDDLHGRYSISRLAQDPEFQRRRQSIIGVSGAGAAKTADVQTMEYLQAKGMPFEQARDMVMLAKTNPQQAISDYAGKILAGQKRLMPGDEGYLSPDQAYQESARIINAVRGQQQGGAIPEPAASAPGAQPQPAAPAARTMTMADVKATAARSGRSEQEVIQAAKSKGFIIQ